jgi:hypothetical protein
VELLEDSARSHIHHTDQQLRALTHRFQEWARRYVPGSSQEIYAKDILEAVGRGDEADEIIADAKVYENFDRLLGKA